MTDRAVRLARPFLLAGALSVLAAGVSLADGFGIYTNGARASGMGGAWVARVIDPSAVFFNPAGMSQLAGTHVYGGAFGVTSPGGVELSDGREFDREAEFFVVPHLYVTHEIDPRLALGLGVFSAYGLGTTWNRRSFPGRFRSYDANLQTIYVQPSASFAPNERLSIGGGVELVRAEVSLSRELDLSTLVLDAAGTTFGQFAGLPPNRVAFLDSDLDASGTGFGFNLGVLLRLNPRVQLGVHYRSQVEIDLEGTAAFTQIPTNVVLGEGNPLGAPAGTPLDAVLRPRLPVSQKARSRITLPDQVVGGVSVTPNSRWMVNADVKWTNWKDFDKIVIDFENANPGEDVIAPEYRNSTSFRVGAEYLASRAVALRAGYVRDESPAPRRSVTPLLPDADRNEVSVGLGYATGLWQIDAFWLVELLEDRAGPVGADDDLPDGTYSTTGYLFGLSFGHSL